MATGFPLLSACEGWFRKSADGKNDKRLPDKTLTMKWEVFRDKLRPGQEEEWKLTVKPARNAGHAEMLATMYDASLDKIWKIIRA